MVSRVDDEPEELTDSPVVIAVDPGGVTGWSILKVHPEALSDPTVRILDNIDHHAHGQIISPANSSDEMRCVDELTELVRQWPGAAVLMEDFILRMYSKGRELLAPVRLNAMLGYSLRMQLGIEVTHLQQPSEAKTSVTDERLKMWGFYEKDGGMGHARDADRHAILFLRKAKDIQKGAMRRALWWPHLYGPDAPYYVPPPSKAKRTGGPMKPEGTLEQAEQAAASMLAPVFQPPRTRPARKRSTMRG